MLQLHVLIHVAYACQRRARPSLLLSASACALDPPVLRTYKCLHTCIHETRVHAGKHSHTLMHAPWVDGRYLRKPCNIGSRTLYTCLYTCRYTYLHTCPYTCLYTYILICLYTYLHASMHVPIHMSIHTSIHMSIHMSTQMATHMRMHMPMHTHHELMDGSCGSHRTSVRER